MTKLKSDITNEYIDMTFCARCKNCPSIYIDKNQDEIVIGGKEEGYTKFTKEQFILFMEQIKKGIFDGYV
tara:strand:- start:232 stop:441 length:210 start_codon:yes stop_codon:yes gene_type:complete